MAAGLKQRFDNWQRRLADRIGTDISTPEARRAAKLHYYLMDHGWLRLAWRNFHEVAPGVYRSNQPSGARLRAIHAKVGLKSVLNLRGPSRKSFHLFETETCAELGLTLADLNLSATKAPTLAKLEELFRLFATLEKPLLLHCKSGADRTGLAAALYLMVVEGQPLALASRQLGLRYTHLAGSSAGIQDHLLRLYARAQAATGVGFLDWMRSDYDPAVLTASFARWRAGEGEGA